MLVDQLASEGYVVVTIDPTYESAAVQFPKGRIVPSDLLSWYAKALQAGTVPQFLKEVVDTRVPADTEFVLNSLNTLPDGLASAVDVQRIGTLEYTAGDPTDTNFSPVAEHCLAAPFLLLGSQSKDACTAATDPSCAAVLNHST
ncbi:hypothetical protein [Actinospica sp.]|uniref:hypothetical protein n=1 Tax=Actinospica sp. TaxID=1872142 RepID=UPI002BEDA8C4|nr:hypothetical protein [Actinospica sp.]HWG24503.1 hypothetical protein [Actinospica sp.]